MNISFLKSAIAMASIHARPAPITPVAPPHLRSALAGAAAAPKMPGYLQSTTSSRASLRPGSPRREKPDPAAMVPAGGVPNRSESLQLDFNNLPERGEYRHTQRRVYNVPQRSYPATVASIAAPSRSGMESPRYSKESLLFAETSTGVQPHERSAYGERPPTARRPPTAPVVSTHDKTLPNKSKSKRGAGSCQRAPELTSTAALANSVTLAASATLLASSYQPPVEPPPPNYFTAKEVARRARGFASPSISRPADVYTVATARGPEAPVPPPPPPVDLSRTTEGSLTSKLVDLRPSGYVGMASGPVRDNLLGGRRARGMCSPRSEVYNPIAWDANPS
jgi:hypothetical protein